MLEKRTQRKKKDTKTSTNQSTLYFAVVRGVLHSRQAEMQTTPGTRGEEL
jgi:hypothetical protein